MLILTAFIVGVFYCLDALYGERRDRSILFWKSLPVSDSTTLLSKATIPLVVLPLVTFAIIVATQLVMMLWTSVLLITSWHEPCIDLDICSAVSEFVHSSLRISRDCSLACADLWLGSVSFRLGAASNFSLGNLAVSRDRVFREDHIRHFAFRLDVERPFDGIRTGRPSLLTMHLESTAHNSRPRAYLSSPGSLARTDICRGISSPQQSGYAVIADRSDSYDVECHHSLFCRGSCQLPWEATPSPTASRSNHLTKSMHPTQESRTHRGRDVSIDGIHRALHSALCPRQTHRARRCHRDRQQHPWLTRRCFVFRSSVISLRQSFSFASASRFIGY